jgi:hypothetical protein
MLLPAIKKNPIINRSEPITDMGRAAFWEIPVPRMIRPARPLKNNATRLPANNNKSTLNTDLNNHIKRTTRVTLEIVIASFLLKSFRSSFSSSCMRVIASKLLPQGCNAVKRQFVPCSILSGSQQPAPLR